MPTNGNFKRELITAILSALVVVLFGVVGWGLLDRLHWAGKENEIDSLKIEVIELKERLARIPEKPASEEGLQDLKEVVKRDHEETLNAIESLRREIYHSMKPGARMMWGNQGKFVSRVVESQVSPAK